MNPHDLMRDAVEGHEPDFDQLTSASRARGTRLRRRRQSLILGTGVASVVLVATAIGFAGSALPGQAGRPASFADSSAEPEPSPSPTPAPPSAMPSPDEPTDDLEGRTVAAGLRDAVEATEDGVASDFRAQSGNEAYAELAWIDSPDEGVSIIGLNLQFFRYVAKCSGGVTRCRSIERPDGSALTTYEQRTPVAGGVGLRWVAELNRADGTRISASSTNGFDLPSSKWDVTRAEPALNFAQLKRVVQEPFWGRDLPAELVSLGADLPGYVDIDSDFDSDAVQVAPTPSAKDPG